MAYVLARRVQHWRVNRYASAVATQQSMPVVSPQSLGWQVNLQARAAPSAQELLMRAPKLHSTKVSSNLYAVTERISPDTAKTQVLRGDALMIAQEYVVPMAQMRRTQNSGLCTDHRCREDPR
mmetsp:Transcript_87633/g.168775  ORF Transcript_87633/g.168775 Transcript_87633/m.168775 type:complete len:123 (+) Transcript_87633:56-424(+)